MTGSAANRAKEVFNEALDRTGAARLQFIEEACGADPGLRSEVEALLSAHDRAAGFMADGGGFAEAAVNLVADEQRMEPMEQPGMRIGPYKLLEIIGEGGFGVVYMAEQVEPIRRRVALKIIKPGMDTRQVIARFEAERQALALMDHPNIAKVLDAGATESGRPFFVMELVRGAPITEYCDANRLTTKDRLALFVDVCKAVHHAHEKGVIHRDIKPSNVMVTLHDGTPVPKVIDFGIAKATNQPLTEKTLFTAFGQFLGTPAYMSPEQAAFGGLEIDRRCDVYSLGVLLYELLTGTTPFEQNTMRSRAFVEMLRIIREEDPPTPSARLNTLGERLAAVAMRRDAEPHALLKALRGDLDWIVMRALEKDRTRRYDSASELARDLGRYFQHEPVSARRPGALYRMSKFAKRRRTWILAGAGMAGAVVLGGGLVRGLGARDAAAGPPTVRMAFNEDDSVNTIPTRDGRHRLRYDRARRGFDLVEIGSGKSTRFFPAAPELQNTLSLSGQTELSPDSRSLVVVSGAGGAYGWGRTTDPTDLTLLSPGGQEQGRLLHRWNERLVRLEVFGWTPDQSRVWVYVMKPDESASIASIDVRDGSEKVLKTLAGRTHTQPPSLSPDGKFITYHDRAAGQKSDIFIVSSDGSHEFRAENPASDVLPVFTPDGSGIVFRSTRKGGDLWFLPVANGRPTGEARAIWDDLGPYGQTLGFTQDGTLYYFYAGSDWEIYTADIDVDRGIIAEPKLLPPLRDDINYTAAYSPDGRTLAHLRSNGRRLVLREISTGSEREIPLPGTTIGSTIDFCPHGRSLVVAAYPATVRVNLGTSVVEPVPLKTDFSSILCLGDGSELLYVPAHTPGEPARIVRRSVASGEERTIYSSPAPRLEFARSPDGKRLAVLTRRERAEPQWQGDVQLAVTPLAGGRAVVVPGEWTGVHGFAWLADGSGLLVARQSPADSADISPQLSLLRVPLDGRAASEIGRLRLPAHQKAIYGSMDYRMHPSGSRIVFTRHAGLVSQVWAIDHLLAFIRSGAPITARQIRGF